MLSIIVTTIFITLVLNIFLKKIHLPTIIGYILTGTIIAYLFGIHEAVHNHTLKEIAEFGVVFLMFTIGLEFSIEHLKKMKYEVFVAGSLQIFLTTSVVFVMAYYIFNIDIKTSFIISLVITLSSTAIVLKTFNETGEINKRYGKRSLGILIMQDIAVIPILLVIGFMSNDVQADISTVLLEMFSSAMLLLMLLFVVGKYLLEPFFNAIAKTKSDELFVSTILFLAIGSSYLAHILGFSYSLGAFMAGMLIAETTYKHQAEADLVPFRDILLGIFFITVGMQINFDVIFIYIHIIAMLLAGVMVLKFFIVYIIVRFNENKRVSFKTALALLQIGEFSLALLELARANSLILPLYGQIFIVTIVLSMIITPFILKNLTLMADVLVTQDEVIQNELDTKTMIDHTIILGFGEFGRNVAKKLKEYEEDYIALDNNLEIYHRAYNDGEAIIFGNASKKMVLESLHIKDAKAIIVAIDNPKKLYSTCENILKIVPSEKLIVKVHSKNEKEMIEHLGVRHIFIENEILSETISELIVLKTHS